MDGGLPLRCSSTSEIVCGVTSERTSVIKIEAGKGSSGVAVPWLRVLLSMLSVFSVVGGGVWVCSNVAMGAYTGPLIVCGGGSVVDVVVEVLCVVLAGQDCVVLVDDSKFVIVGDDLWTSVLDEVA